MAEKRDSYKYTAEYKGKLVFTGYSPTQVEIVRSMKQKGFSRYFISRETGIPYSSINYVAALDHNQDTQRADE